MDISLYLYMTGKVLLSVILKIYTQKINYIILKEI
jgi:hypothetical protein